MINHPDSISPDLLAAGKITGKLTVIDPHTNTKKTLVLQRTSPALANIKTELHPRLQLRTEPGGRKGNTPKQQQQRAIFADAVAAWQALTDTERAHWAAERAAAGATISIYHFFMSRYMDSHTEQGGG